MSSEAKAERLYLVATHIYEGHDSPIRVFKNLDAAKKWATGVGEHGSNCIIYEAKPIMKVQKGSPNLTKL